MIKTYSSGIRLNQLEKSMIARFFVAAGLVVVFFVASLLMSALGATLIGPGLADGATTRAWWRYFVTMEFVLYQLAVAFLTTYIATRKRQLRHFLWIAAPILGVFLPGASGFMGLTMVGLLLMLALLIYQALSVRGVGTEEIIDRASYGDTPDSVVPPA